MDAPDTIELPANLDTLGHLRAPKGAKGVSSSPLGQKCQVKQAIPSKLKD